MTNIVELVLTSRDLSACWLLASLGKFRNAWDSQIESPTNAWELFKHFAESGEIRLRTNPNIFSDALATFRCLLVSRSDTADDLYAFRANSVQIVGFVRILWRFGVHSLKYTLRFIEQTRGDRSSQVNSCRLTVETVPLPANPPMESTGLKHLIQLQETLWAYRRRKLNLQSHGFRMCFVVRALYNALRGAGDGGCLTKISLCWSGSAERESGIHSKWSSIDAIHWAKFLR